jgi:hypothetical protein
MNEPKKRGRPAKAKVLEASPQEQAADNKATVKLTVASLPGCEVASAKYAVRVWNGQSDSIPVRERIKRVINALRGQELIPAETEPDQRTAVLAMLAAQGIRVKSLEL